MSNKSCILCVNSISRSIKIFGRRGRSLNISQIISKHFWFSVESNNCHNEICIKCWLKVKLFNDFYENVREAHLKLANEIATPIKPFESQQQTPNLLEGYHPDELTESEMNPSHLNMTFEIKDEIVESDMEPIEFALAASIVEEHDPTINEILEGMVAYQSHSSPKTENDDCGDDLNMDSESDDNQDAHMKQEVTQADSDELQLEGKIADYFQMNCDLCSEQLQSMDDVQLHFTNKHSVIRGYLRCCDCGNKKFNMRKAILDHVKWHFDPNAFKCTECSKTFNAQRRLTAHMERHHAEAEKLIFNCLVCDKRFSKKHMLNEHVNRVHPPEDQIFTCDLCEKRYKTRKLLHNHIQTTHNERDTKHICDICAKVMCSKYSLKEHLKTHADHGQLLKCDECGAMLKNQSTLIKHKTIHTDGKQTCNICFKVKPNRTALRNHMNNVHGVPKHKCTFCEKSFRRLMSLKEHIATHTGEALYTCMYCPTTFKSNANKFKHLRQVHHKESTVKKEITSKNSIRS